RTCGMSMAELAENCLPAETLSPIVSGDSRRHFRRIQPIFARIVECLPDAAFRAAELGNVCPMRGIGRPNSGMFARCGVSGGRTRECSPDARYRASELGNVRPMRGIGRPNSGMFARCGVSGGRTRESASTRRSLDFENALLIYKGCIGR